MGRVRFHNTLTALLGTTTRSGGYGELLIGQAGDGLIIGKRPL